MGLENKYIRHGIGTARAYVYGDLALPEFVKQVFGAEVLEEVKNGSKGAHVEMRFGDSVVVIETGEFEATAPRSSLYIYLQDVDATYSKAIQSGATSVEAPSDKPYQERAAGIKDSFGNTWWITSVI